VVKSRKISFQDFVKEFGQESLIDFTPEGLKGWKRERAATVDEFSEPRPV
jgi:hypothetical protein